ncbi:MAG: uroporphyrinogen decarboxylase family protein [Candidatus Latescibacteria bacterium]|nr:uroporphyrinogen decarboxylase family protein [Candidatus Latescibacterota bacterium]
MTPKERLLTALKGGIPDRAPMPLRMWKFLRKYYGDGVPLLDKILRAHDEFGIDVWYSSVGFPHPCFSPVGTPWRDDVSVEIAHEVRGNRNYWERTVHTPEGDLHDEKFALIIKEGSGSGPEIMEPLVKDPKRDIPLLRYMQPDPEKTTFDGAWETDRQIGDKGLLVASIYSPIDCRDVMRPDDFMFLYHDDREAFREIVEIGAEAMMAETRRVLEEGLRVFQAWWFYASPSYGWGPKIYEEMFLPHVVRHVELVHSYDGIYVYYDDGKMADFMDMYVSAGIDAMMTLTPPPMGDAVPKEVKAKYGDSLALMGGVDAVNEVYLSNPDEIRKMTRERLETYMPGGGYIFDGSNSLVYETPPENVHALAEAAQEFGGY